MRMLNLFLALLLVACSDIPPPAQPPISVSAAMGDDAHAGFARATQPRAFQFPRDHGPHPEYQHEWWYLTGNLTDPAGRRFGYQVTLFRIGLAREQSERASAWATRQLWMGHAALSDPGDAGHLKAERFARDALGLAGARSTPPEVWLEDWQLLRADDNGLWRLSIPAPAQGFHLDLELQELRAPLPQGDAGLSQKSPEPGNASHYYSITRLATRGAIQVNGQSHPVSGLSWLDREWSTSALGPDQVGWDWFSLQLQDGTDVMFYQLRKKQGGADPLSRGSALLADQTRLDLRAQDVRLTPLRWWQGPQGQRYPVAWRMQLLPLDRTLLVSALIPDQLMDLTVRYWEGAVRVSVPGDDTPIGYGYLELAGY